MEQPAAGGGVQDRETIVQFDALPERVSFPAFVNREEIVTAAPGTVGAQVQGISVTEESAPFDLQAIKPVQLVAKGSSQNLFPAIAVHIGDGAVVVAFADVFLIPAAVAVDPFVASCQVLYIQCVETVAALEMTVLE